MQINIEKKHFYTILGFIILITSGVIIYANVDTIGAWHDADSIQITINNVQMSLQQAIENGNLTSKKDLTNYATKQWVTENFDTGGGVDLQDHLGCYDNSVYWFSNNNEPSVIKESCTFGCANAKCITTCPTYTYTMPTYSGITWSGTAFMEVTGIDGKDYSMGLWNGYTKGTISTPGFLEQGDYIIGNDNYGYFKGAYQRNIQTDVSGFTQTYKTYNVCRLKVLN